MKDYKIYVIFILVCIPNIFFGQNYYEKGKEEQNKGHFKEAIELFDLAIESAKKTVDKNPLDLVKCLRSADENDKLYSEMLDDSKIVNQTIKTLKKVIMKYGQNKK